MKPGNLSERMMVPNPAATKDEDSILFAHRIFGVRFFFLGTALKNLSRWCSGSFRTTRHNEDLEIHKVFLRSPLLDLYENLSLPIR